VQEPDNDEVEVKSTESGDEWFKQVMDLRQRAHSYFLRDRDGNHFSRSYLRQLEEELANILKETSSKVDKKKKPSGEPPTEKPSCPVEPQGEIIAEERPIVKEAWTETPKRKSNHSDESDEGIHSPSASEAGSYRQSAADQREGAVRSSSESSSSSMTICEEDGDAGRLSTPQLQIEPNGRRHHLDATTPVRGGALLSSPVLPPSHTYKVPSKNVIDSKTHVINRESVATQSPDRFSDSGSEMDLPTTEKDEDILSVSAMSSRSSIAAETLSRAEKRKNDFWK